MYESVVRTRDPFAFVDATVCPHPGLQRDASHLSRPNGHFRGDLFPLSATQPLRGVVSVPTHFV